jgi:hypothetical protein
MERRQEQPNTSEQEECGSSVAKLRQKELAEAEEMRERGTLTPEAAKQGVTSHLPVEETEYMYRSEDHRENDGGSPDASPAKPRRSA